MMMPTIADEEEQAVGDRIEHLAQVGHLVAAAGDVAVDPVGGAQHGEEHRRRGEGVLDEQQPHEDREAQTAGRG